MKKILILCLFLTACTTQMAPLKPIIPVETKMTSAIVLPPIQKQDRSISMDCQVEADYCSMVTSLLKQKGYAMTDAANSHYLLQLRSVQLGAVTLDQEQSLFQSDYGSAASKPIAKRPWIGNLEEANLHTSLQKSRYSSTIDVQLSEKKVQTWTRYQTRIVVATPKDDYQLDDVLSTLLKASALKVISIFNQ